MKIQKKFTTNAIQLGKKTKPLNVLIPRAYVMILAVSLVSVATLASAGSGGHGNESIPLDKIGWQAANLGILLVAIFFFIKKSIIEAFKNRQKNYLEKFEKTQGALKNAELILAEIKAKLANLEAGEKNSIESAQREAEILKAQIIAEAVVAAAKIKKDVELTINNELNSAKVAITRAILNQAVVATAKTLGEKNQTGAASQTTQSTTQQEAAFLKQIEQVRA